MTRDPFGSANAEPRDRPFLESLEGNWSSRWTADGSPWHPGRGRLVVDGRHSGGRIDFRRSA